MSRQPLEKRFCFRWKTMGANTDENAHPFVEKTIMGAHNGIVYNWPELSQAMGKSHKRPIEVDSQVAFRLFSEVQPKPEQIVQVIPMMRGQLALTWYDTRDKGALWVFRHENPITMAVVPSAQSMFWSSEYGHLAACVQAAYGSEWEPVVIAPDTLYRFRWDNGLQKESWAVEMPVYGAKPVAVVSKKKKKGKKNKTKPVTVTALTELIDRQFPVRVPAAILRVNPREYEESLEECNMCHSDVDWDDDNAQWHNEGEGYMMCGPCERWWTSTGSGIYRDLEEAVAVSDTSGQYANDALLHHVR